jgi:hypothetical protein
MAILTPIGVTKQLKLSPRSLSTVASISAGFNRVRPFAEKLIVVPSGWLAHRSTAAMDEVPVPK